MISAYPTPWDVLIVGSGPAGLFAALSLAKSGMNRILLIDSGDDIRARAQRRETNPSGTDLVRGVGGAGLFSDGKLCLSLDVGGALSNLLSGAERSELLSDIESVFDRLLPGCIADAKREKPLDAVGTSPLEFKYYPVAHIGTDRCADIIKSLRAELCRMGVTIVAKCTLTELRRSLSGFRATTDNSRYPDIHARRVVLACGKYGSEFQARTCKRLGVAAKRVPLYLGVRFETDASGIENLFHGHKDPKFSLLLPDGSKVKTHCATNNGAVVELDYDGVKLAGGHNYSQYRTGRSGFGILWNGYSTGDHPRAAADAVLRPMNARAENHIMVQRLSDFFNEVPSTELSLRGVKLTNTNATPGNVRAHLPANCSNAIHRLLNEIARVSPGALDDSGVLYGPAVEWWMERIDVESKYLETSCDGLFVCGDGSGWSQGIVHAAATGLLAAEGVKKSQDVVSNRDATGSVSV